MVKAIEVIVVITLLIFAFVAGVKYSDSVKNHASWLFETKEEEVELPDLSNENTSETPAESAETNSSATAPQDGGAPMDDLEAAKQPTAPTAAAPARK
jgi:hypothetical protein